MGMLNFLYGWVLPNKQHYINGYKNNEQHYSMARSLWDSLESASIYFLLVAIVFAILLACCYYYGYNKLPGRKYKISHWVIWIGITAVVTILLTMVLGNVMVSSTLKEQVGFILRISLINGLYASVVYFIVSFFICNLPVPTNAYRFLKIK